MEKQFTAKYTPEAEKDLKGLQKQDVQRVFRTVAYFEQLGAEGVNSRPLNKDGLFEMKCDKIRIYFMYQDNKIVIIGLITLKKTQKAPERLKVQAMTSIAKYIRNKSNENK